MANIPPIHSSSPQFEGKQPVPPPPSIEHGAASEGIMSSAFARLMGPAATPDQVKQFINILNQNIANQIKQDLAKAREASEKLKEALDGDD